MHNCLTPFVNEVLSNFISAYRKGFGSNHVLIRLIEDWKKSLDNKNIVGAVLIDLSKAFDCIPHDLLIAKMSAYGFSMDTLVFMYSYLKRRKQSVKINNTESLLKILISGVPQGSILGPILFNLFINDLFLFIKKANLANFADDNTLYAASKDISTLLEILKSETEEAIKWFETNNMFANPDKFQAIVVHHNKNVKGDYNIDVNNIKIKSTNSVKLLGVEIDNNLNFGKHVSSLCQKAANQLNAISRLKNYMGKKEIEVLINSFIYSNFNYCPLVWHFCSKKAMKKIDKNY